MSFPFRLSAHLLPLFDHGVKLSTSLSTLKHGPLYNNVISGAQPWGCQVLTKHHLFPLSRVMLPIHTSVI